jgi:hypothetical protein
VTGAGLTRFFPRPLLNFRTSFLAHRYVTLPGRSAQAWRGRCARAPWVASVTVVPCPRLAPADDNQCDAQGLTNGSSKPPGVRPRWGSPLFTLDATRHLPFTGQRLDCPRPGRTTANRLALPLDTMDSHRSSEGSGRYDPSAIAAPWSRGHASLRHPARTPVWSTDGGIFPSGSRTPIVIAGSRFELLLVRSCTRTLLLRSY